MMSTDVGHMSDICQTGEDIDMYANGHSVDMLSNIYPTFVGLHFEVQSTRCRHLPGQPCQTMSD